MRCGEPRLHLPPRAVLYGGQGIVDRITPVGVAADNKEDPRPMPSPPGRKHRSALRPCCRGVYADLVDLVAMGEVLPVPRWGVVGDGDTGRVSEGKKLIPVSVLRTDRAGTRKTRAERRYRGRVTPGRSPPSSRVRRPTRQRVGDSWTAWVPTKTECLFREAPTPGWPSCSDDQSAPSS